MCSVANSTIAQQLLSPTLYTITASDNVLHSCPELSGYRLGNLGGLDVSEDFCVVRTNGGSANHPIGTLQCQILHYIFYSVTLS